MKTFAIAALAIVANTQEIASNFKAALASDGAISMATVMGLKESLHAQYRAEGKLPLAGVKSDREFKRCEETGEGSGGVVGIPYGFAGEYPCSRIDFYSMTTHFDLGSTVGEGNDLWGWTDPETGWEIAIVGQADGMAFARIEEDGTATYLGRVQTTTDASLWRDVKNYGPWALMVSEAQNHGVVFFDMRKLRDADIDNPQTYEPDTIYRAAGHTSSHNIVVDEESGYAYSVGTRTYSGGLHVINIKDPLNPTFEGGFAEVGYIHDAQCLVYRGPDPDYYGRQVCACYSVDELAFVDVTEKDNMKTISRITWDGVKYSHQGWWSYDWKTVLLNDEVDEYAQFLDGVSDGKTNTLIFDVRNLSEPILRGSQRSLAVSVDHNLYTRGQYVFESNYASGLRVYDSTVVRWGFMYNSGYFDVFPEEDVVAFLGAWSVYPYFKSNFVIINSMDRGLFIVKPRWNLPPVGKFPGYPGFTDPTEDPPSTGETEEEEEEEEETPSTGDNGSTSESGFGRGHSGTTDWFDRVEG